MSGVPYIRFFGDDWLSGTNALSLEERGALITISALTASTGGPVACDYDRLSRRMGCTKGRVKKVLAALVDQEKIQIADGMIYNERALKETKISQKKSEKATESVQARWSKSDGKPNIIKDGDDTNVIRTYRPSIYQPEPEPEPEKEDTKVSPKRPPIRKLVSEILCQVAPPEAVAGFVEMRWAIKAPMTVRSANLIANKLRGNSNAEAILDLSTENNWKTVYPDSNQLNGGNNGKRNYKNRQASGDAIFDEARKRALRLAAIQKAPSASGF